MTSAARPAPRRPMLAPAASPARARWSLSSNASFSACPRRSSTTWPSTIARNSAQPIPRLHQRISRHMSLIIRSSDIHAAGCYTTAPIAKGARIIAYAGDRVSNEEGNRLYKDKDYTYLFALDGGTHMVDGYGMAIYINHSCDPNCETVETDGRIWINALRNIKAGEELTYDYNLFDGEGDAPCSCGAHKCRGTMYSRDEVGKLTR